MAEAKMLSYVPINSPEEALVWHHLLRLHNGEFGAPEEELRIATKMERVPLLKILESLCAQDLIAHRLQKVGTGGNTDHYYRLVGRRYRIVLEHEKP